MCGDFGLSSKQRHKSRAGGAATIGGVAYQLLWTLARAMPGNARAELKRKDVNDGLLIVEPSGGGGDAVEQRKKRRIVTQLKVRADDGPWSLQEVITKILPDLVKAHKKRSATTYQFVTNGHIGDWRGVYEWFASFRPAADGDSPVDRLSDIRLLRVGAKLSSTGGDGFWTKAFYGEQELFSKIVDAVGAELGAKHRRNLKSHVAAVLADFQIHESVTQEQIEREIDECIGLAVDAHEQTRQIREAAVTRLARRVSGGEVTIDTKAFFNDIGLTGVVSTPELVDNTARVTRDMARRKGFQPSHHVQHRATEALLAELGRGHVLVLTGETAGKSWHACALACELTARQSLAALVDCGESARATLEEATRSVWNVPKRHDLPIVFERAMERLPRGIGSRVLIVDSVDDPRVAVELATMTWDSWGWKLVLVCGKEIAGTVRSITRGRCQQVETSGFEPSELNEYLGVRGVDHCDQLPGHMRRQLEDPLFAALYCEMASGGTWTAASEYELLDRYWTTKVLHNAKVDKTLDIAFLRDMVRQLFRGSTYPWHADTVYRRLKIGDTLSRLKDSGILAVGPDGACRISHHRVFNWAVAATITQDYVSKRCDAARTAELCTHCANRTAFASNVSMGYVPMDALWLMSEHKAGDALAAVMQSLESSQIESDLYTDDLIVTLGPRIVPWLLSRLDRAGEKDGPARAYQIIECLAKVPAPETKAKVASWLRATPKLQSVGVRLAAVQPDADFLDLLWQLHVGAAPSTMEKPDFDHPNRLSALAACVAKRPEWLADKLSGATASTPRLDDLVLLLARNPEMSEVWRTTKAHLKAILPENKRRSLVYCIRAFSDGDEVAFMVEMTQQGNWDAEAAFAALSRLDPETALTKLAESDAQFLTFTRGWHFQPLLLARPQQAQYAIRRVAQERGQAGMLCEMYRGVENEIDVKAFDLVLDALADALRGELGRDDTKAHDANSGPIHGLLAFVGSISRLELLDRLGKNGGGDVASFLTRYLLAIGPRDDVSARLNDDLGMHVLQRMNRQASSQVVKAWLRASSWYGRIDGLDEAHKAADEDIVDLLRRSAMESGGEDNARFEQYLASHALCHLERWDILLPLIERDGLAISPYLLEQRRGKAALTYATVEQAARDAADGRITPGRLLVLGVSRDSKHSELIISVLSLPAFDRDVFLSAAIAADLLELTDDRVTDALGSRLEDESLRLRVMEFLLRIGTPRSLEFVARSIEDRFHVATCIALGECDGFEKRAAAIAWQNRVGLERRSGFSELFALISRHLDADVRPFLARFAFGHSSSSLDKTAALNACRALATLDREDAYRALRIGMERINTVYRLSYPQAMVDVNADRAKSDLFSAATADADAELLIAIGNALRTLSIEGDLLEMTRSRNPPGTIRAACLIASRRRLSPELSDAVRQHVLSVDEAVGRSARFAIREDLRARRVEALFDRMNTETDVGQRAVLFDLLTEAARGNRNRPTVIREVTDKVWDSLTPLEADILEKALNKGAEEFRKSTKVDVD